MYCQCDRLVLFRRGKDTRVIDVIDEALRTFQLLIERRDGGRTGAHRHQTCSGTGRGLLLGENSTQSAVFVLRPLDSHRYRRLFVLALAFNLANVIVDGTRRRRRTLTSSGVKKRRGGRTRSIERRMALSFALVEISISVGHVRCGVDPRDLLRMTLPTQRGARQWFVNLKTNEGRWERADDEVSPSRNVREPEGRGDDVVRCSTLHWVK